MGMVQRPLAGIKRKWEEALGKEIPDEDWVRILEYPQKISRNTRLKYLQFNYVHQTYLTPSKITAIYGGEVRKCPRCGSIEADFVHMVWSCPHTGMYWERVTSKLQQLLHRAVPCTLEACILGLFSRPKPKKVGNRFIDLALALAKRQISLNWKAAHGPQISKWELDLMRWGKAEEQALRREETRGIRKNPVASLWAEVMHSVEFPDSEDSDDTDEDNGTEPPPIGDLDTP